MCVCVTVLRSQICGLSFHFASLIQFAYPDLALDPKSCPRALAALTGTYCVLSVLAAYPTVCTAFRLALLSSRDLARDNFAKFRTPDFNAF